MQFSFFLFAFQIVLYLSIHHQMLIFPSLIRQSKSQFGLQQIEVRSMDKLLMQGCQRDQLLAELQILPISISTSIEYQKGNYTRFVLFHCQYQGMEMGLLHCQCKRHTNQSTTRIYQHGVLRYKFSSILTVKDQQISSRISTRYKVNSSSM